MRTVVASSSIERIDPADLNENDATGEASYRIHMERYRFAGNHCRQGRLLDIACGVGYGAAYLSNSCQVSEVLGVDIDDHALSVARSRYGSEKTSFMQADALTFQPEQAFDAVVSLETVEHLDEPARFAGRVHDVFLRAGGIFVTSAPVTPSVDFNPYHCNDFSPASFKAMVTKAGFEIIDEYLQVQHFNPLSILMRKEQRLQDARRNVLGYYAENPGKLALRLRSILMDGFANKYLTLACRKR